MARAVIKLSEDISPVMAYISSAIKGCAYNQESNVAAFRYGDMRVIVEKNQVTIHGAEDESTAKSVLEWLADQISNNV